MSKIERLRNEVANGKGAGFAETEALLDLVEAQHGALGIAEARISDRCCCLAEFDTCQHCRDVGQLKPALAAYEKFDGGSDV